MALFFVVDYRHKQYGLLYGMVSAIHFAIFSVIVTVWFELHYQFANGFE